jgi:hypothetical protein
MSGLVGKSCDIMLLFWLEVLCSKLTVFQDQSLVEQVGQNPEQIRFQLDAFGIDLVGEQDQPTSTPRRGHRRAHGICCR